MNVLAADIGGTTIKLGVVSEGLLLGMDSILAQAEQPMTDRLEAIMQGWQRLLDARGLTLEDANGVGLSLPFLIDRTGTQVSGDFDKFSSAARVNFPAWASERLGLPLVMENDLRMALLGEWNYGAARDHSDVVMLALGTGIGCAAICNGRMLQGSQNKAGAVFGHMTVSLDLPPGRCGNLGCAEDLASTATLAQRARGEPGFDSSPLADCEKLDYERLFKLADDGDACSKRLLDRSLKVWSVLAMNAVLAYDPAVLVLGGGVLRRKETIIPAIQNHLARSVADVPHDIPVVVGTLGDRAALHGCEILFLDRIKRE